MRSLLRACLVTLVALTAVALPASAQTSGPYGTVTVTGEPGLRSVLSVDSGSSLLFDMTAVFVVPASPVVFYLLSTPVTVAEVTSGADGAIPNVELDLPGDLSGRHHIVVVDTATFEGDINTFDPAAPGAADVAGIAMIQPLDVDSDTLPVTGASSGTLAGVAAAIVAAGVAATVLARRRSEPASDLA